MGLHTTNLTWVTDTTPGHFQTPDRGYMAQNGPTPQNVDEAFETATHLLGSKNVSATTLDHLYTPDPGQMGVIQTATPQMNSKKV